MDRSFKARFGSKSLNVLRRVVAQAQEFFYLPSLGTRQVKLTIPNNFLDFYEVFVSVYDVCEVFVTFYDVCDVFVKFL